jgi:hypothetical protein
VEKAARMIEFNSTIVCPACGYRAEEEMPPDT